MKLRIHLSKLSSSVLFLPMSLPMVVAPLFLIWGFSMGRFEVFPFPQLQAIKLHFLPLEGSEKSTDLADSTDSKGRELRWQMQLDQFKVLDTRPDIVMLGDSNTDGAEWQELFPIASIANRGIGGDTTKGILQRISELQQRNPKIVFVLIGTNDLSRGETVENVFARYETIVASLVDSDTTVIVQSTLLTGENLPDKGRTQVTQLNRKLEKMAKRLNLQYVDLNELLAPEGFLSSKFTLDGIHLNGLGYKVWAKAIEKYIK